MTDSPDPPDQDPAPSTPPTAGGGDPNVGATNTTAGSVGERAPASRLRVIGPLVGIVAVLAILAVAVATSSHSKPKLPGNVSSTASAAFAGSALTPAKPAPPIALKSYTGQPVTLRQYRGKPVLVTFLYTHCPDVCPLIATHLRALQARLGPKAADVPIIAVSVDPRRDTRKTIAKFLRAHDMTGRMQYLVGSAAQLGRTWAAWNVGSQKDASNPEFVAHSALVYGISASGKVTTIYPADFKPANIAHDIPLLARR